MSHIIIKANLRPYSHTPGVFALIPASPCAVQIFPTRLIGYDLLSNYPLFEMALPFRGPPRGFTVLQDIDKKFLMVQGHFKEGFVRYKILHTSQGILVDLPSAPRVFDAPMPFAPRSPARLFFGCHKTQQVERILERGDPTELYPFIYALGSLMPHIPFEGDLALEDIIYYLDGLFTPHITDIHHLGFTPTLRGSSPLSVLKRGSELIEKHLFEIQEGGPHILPNLPSKWHCGKFINLQTLQATYDIEWSNKKLRRLQVRPHQNGPLKLRAQKSLCSCRKNGLSHPLPSTLEIIDGQMLLLDRFEK